MGHKLTVRLDARELELLVKLTYAIGASQTAIVQALIDTAAQAYEEQGWAHPSAWPPGSSGRECQLETAEMAKAIDNARRSRS